MTRSRRGFRAGLAPGTGEPLRLAGDGGGALGAFVGYAEGGNPEGGGLCGARRGLFRARVDSGAAKEELPRSARLGVHRHRLTQAAATTAEGPLLANLARSQSENRCSPYTL